MGTRKESNKGIPVVSDRVSRNPKSEFKNIRFLPVAARPSGKDGSSVPCHLISVI